MNRQLQLICGILLVSGYLGQAQPCAPNEIEVSIQVVTDSYGYETSWTLVNSEDDTIALGGQGGVYANNASYDHTVCVPDDECLTFRIEDTYGDGNCCAYGEGSYTVLMEGQQVATGGDFDYVASHSFNCPPGSNCSSPLTATLGTHAAPAADTWYSFTPQQNGNYEITTCNNGCDTKIWIYDYCNNLLWDNTNVGTIYYDDNQGGCGEHAVIPAALLEGGVEYWIRIGTDNGSCTGPIEWSIFYNGEISGCMDPTNCHYNPLATISIPCEPCTDGPDLILRQDVLQSSMYLSSMNVAQGDCFIEELCMNGYGMRDILRFTTHILNIGTLDYYIGNPSANPDQFDFDNCHGHTHYAGYAAYRLYDTEANEIPIGFKNGFCVMDLECSGGGTAQYGCSTMGISAGCGDIYSSGLSCQWIDITDVDTGLYTFVVTTNWDQDPDALGHHELSYTNNWAQVCIYIGRDGNGDLYVDQVEDCNPYVDCNGEIFGSAQPDCNGDCGGVALRGDLDVDTAQTLTDGQMYVDAILANSLTPATCNDLNMDNEIDVFDAALITDCALYNNGQSTGAIYNHCAFPYGLSNPYDTVELSIGSVDHAQHFIDIYIKNPGNKVVAYQFEMSGLEIQSVENLVDPAFYPATPQWEMNGNMVVGISYQDSLIPKYAAPSPLCRIYYSSLTDTMVCISDIQSVVNQDYEETVTAVDPFHTCIIAHVGIDELVDGGVLLDLYPNPMNDVSTLKITNRFNANISVELIDPSGKRVKDYGRITGNRLSIEKGQLRAGMYFIQVVDENRILTRKKLIIQ